ncbi:RNA polymerase sigma factor [Sphingobacterium sp. LRF_L2]|uniref:RNA polymerase sigma factor n=1 Tax=Sphingobacterium sp. LRF_L2 TaxID=3369421 RepID=UPI003F6304F7
MNFKEADNEKSLISRLKTGDEQAFLVIYKKYSSVLWSFLQKLRLEQQDLEDVVQQTFSKLWEKRDNLDEDLSIKSYLITIAKNDIYNKIKQQVVHKKHQEQLIQLHPKESTPHNNELKEILYKILENLPDKRREVFELSRIKGYSNDEISKKLGISKSTVENHIYNSSTYVKKILKNLGFILVFIFY